MDTTAIHNGMGAPVADSETGAGWASFGLEPVSALEMKWCALHEAANAIAAIAGIEPGAPPQDLRDFPEIMREAGGWRRRLAEQGIADLTAIMEPGLSALLAALTRGADPRDAALTLGDEFVAARNALLELVPGDHALPHLT